MKQKRSKPQLNETVSKMPDQSSTRTGGTSDPREKRVAKPSECASGICVVTWKPNVLKFAQ